MSGSDYGAMTTARLLEGFVANAKAAGNMLSRSWIPSNLILERQEKLKPATRFTDWDVDQSAMDLRNDIRMEIWDVMRELKARGALGKLVPHMASPNPAVRREAATACLRIAEKQSMAVLENIAANGGDDDKYAAKDALIHWREEGVVVYGL